MSHEVSRGVAFVLKKVGIFGGATTQDTMRQLWFLVHVDEQGGLVLKST